MSAGLFQWPGSTSTIRSPWESGVPSSSRATGTTYEIFLTFIPGCSCTEPGRPCRARRPCTAERRIRGRPPWPARPCGYQPRRNRASPQWCLPADRCPVAPGRCRLRSSAAGTAGAVRRPRQRRRQSPSRCLPIFTALLHRRVPVPASLRSGGESCHGGRAMQLSLPMSASRRGRKSAVISAWRRMKGSSVHSAPISVPIR